MSGQAAISSSAN